MRIAFIGKSHSFSLLPLDALQRKHKLVAIIESGPREATSWHHRARHRAATITARWRQRDSLARRASEANAAYLWLDRQARGQLVPLLQAAKPDLICVASLTQLLSSEVLSLPRHGVINVHPSLLPLYRGPFPWFWQYHDFQLRIGVTVHLLDEGEDTGPIVEQAPLDLHLGTDIHDAMDAAGHLGASLIVRATERLAQGSAVLHKQNPSPHPRARVVTRDEQFIDWETWPIERIWHFMRGTYPWVEHFARPKGSPVGPYVVGPLERLPARGVPGVLSSDAEGYFVPHADGTIRINF